MTLGTQAGVARRISDSKFDLAASSIVLLSNAADSDLFFFNGLASNLCKPSKAAWKNGYELEEGRPFVDIECI